MLISLNSVLIGDELKTYLKADAKQKSVVFSPFFFHASEKTDYELFDLELFSKCKISESNDHDYFHKRQRYSASINHSLKQKLSDNDLLYKHESSDSNKYQPKGVTCIAGAHGYGKTAIAKRYLKRYSTDELQNLDYVFLLQGRRINFDTRSNLLELLAKSLPFSWICDKTACDNVLDELFKSEKVLIIIDDLHCAKEHFLSTSAATSLKDETTAAAFIKSLLSAKSILPNARVLVTVRPKPLYDPKLEFYSHHFYNILGLSNASQNKICQIITKSSSKTIFRFISFHPFLKSFCSVPINCPFVMFAANSSLSKNIPFFSLPLTRIVIHAYLRLLQSQSANLHPGVLEELAKKAWEQICDKKLNDFAKDPLLDEAVSTFFKVFSVAKEQPTQPLMQFHHLWLELLAAFHCVLTMDADIFNNFLFSNAIEDRNQPWRFVAMHVASMFDENTLKYVERLLPHFQFDKKIFSQKMEALIKMVVQKLQTPTRFSSFLFASGLVHSMQYKELAKVCANQLGDILVISGEFYSSDITGLHYVLQDRTKPIRLKVDPNTNFNENSRSILVQALEHLRSIQVFRTIQHCLILAIAFFCFRISITCYQKDFLWIYVP